MRKNNKYRSNNNNNYNYNSQAYTLNYKFDSISVAGKICGTALDLIKKYNELAKEAQGNANYVEAEHFRQYAEHYRKIVTDINERKNQHFNNSNRDTQAQTETTSEPQNIEAPQVQQESAEVVASESKPQPRKRTFKVVDIKAAPAETTPEVVATVKRAPRPRINTIKVETEPAAI